jgi:dipeptidyl aminopeptidase/acylaminoacyl peptidase
MKRAFFLLVLLCLAVIAPLVRAQEGEQSEREAMYYRYLEFASYVKGGSIQPHWMADGSSFWYAEGSPANTVIWKVDPRANTKTRMFDTERLRQALSSVLGHEPPYQGLPFETFAFVDNSEQAVEFTVEDKEFILHLDTYTITPVPPLSEEEKSRLVPQIVQTRPERMEVLSPDGRWFAGLKEYNLWLRSTFDGRSVQLTTDGIEDYGGARSLLWHRGPWAAWAPNSLKLAALKSDVRKARKIPIVHWLMPEPEVEWARGPGVVDLLVVDILSKRQVHVDTAQRIQIVGWSPDGSELVFWRTNTTAQTMDLIAANPETGTTRVILTETRETFVASASFDVADVFTLLTGGKRFVWISERDGWKHLYLYNLDGTLIRRLTEGAFPVVRVIAVDEQAGWVYFTAHGDQQRPYDTHLYRVNLEGKNFTRLTEASGQHAIDFAPSKEFYLDTHSTVARPPTVELRRADGTLLQTLSRANIDALKEELQWSPPEEFVVKAADGKTDLYGILYKPYDFDPNKKYPVIEHIYGRSNRTNVPRTFGMRTRTSVVSLGFIVFMVDARGTPERGKAFNDAFYGNAARYRIPDHVAALKQVAAQRPYMDLNRVGIYGGSAGGYNTVRAMLLASDVYHVGIAAAGTTGPRPGLSPGHQPYMGLPQNNKEGYEYADQLRWVGNLKGKLLLINGTSDVAADFGENMKLVEALIRAGKPFDMLVLPEQGHRPTGASRTYRREAIRRYFQDHLKP